MKDVAASYGVLIDFLGRGRRSACYKRNKGGTKHEYTDAENGEFLPYIDLSP